VGVRVGESVLERLRGTDNQAAEAMAITLEIAGWLRQHVNGVQITSFHGSPQTTERLLTEFGRPEHA
jgi:hypothetical protein